MTTLTFDNPAQPIRISVAEPEFPVSHKGNFHCNPKRWESNQYGEATFEINLSISNIQMIRSSKIVWITVATFGSPLQPIKLMCSNN